MPRKQEAPAGEIAGPLCDSFAGLSPIPHSSHSNGAQFPILAEHCGTEWVANLAAGLAADFFSTTPVKLSHSACV